MRTQQRILANEGPRWAVRETRKWSTLYASERLRGGPDAGRFGRRTAAHPAVLLPDERGSGTGADLAPADASVSSGLMVAGNGLATILKVAQHWSHSFLCLCSCSSLHLHADRSQSWHPGFHGSGSNATRVTWRSQSPTLQIDSVRSARRPRSTPPKWPEPVTASWPLGALPDTASVRGPPGSSLEMVSVADFDPKLVGWKRICASTELPAATVSGTRPLRVG
jgi:hypothetical protein